MSPTLRHAFRSLRRSPALGVAAIICIGLGTAATSTVATLVSATLLRPVPFPDADRLVRIWLEEPNGSNRISFSIPEVFDFSRMRSFDAFFGTARVRIVALFEGGAERLRGEGVSRDYFQTLGIRAAAGRLLESDDHAAGAPPVVMISYGTWVRHYGREPVIGRQLKTERASYAIVGITQQGFAGTVEDDVVEFFMPIEQYEPQAMVKERTLRPAWVIGRLREGVAPAAAQDEAQGVLQRLREQYPDIYKQRRARIEALGENWREKLRNGGTMLFGAAALLLMVAAINVGCLLLARVLDRRRELAICAALGADRGRLTRQLFTEALVLVAAGGALGALAGPWVLDAFLVLSPVALPQYLALEVDTWTVALAVSTLGVAGLLAGTVPAILGRRVSPNDVLRESGRGTLGRGAEQRWGALLIAGETALTIVLLVAGGLLVRSYERLSTLDIGFERERIARLAVTLSREDVVDRSRLPALYERLRRELETMPGVERVGLVSPTLPPWNGQLSRVRFEGLDANQSPDGLLVGEHMIDSGLLPMLRIPIVAGRNIEGGDDASRAPVAVISRSLAMRMGGVEKALGRELTFEERAPDDMTAAGSFRVVGVAENVAWDGLVEEDTRRYIRIDGADARTAGYDVYVPLARFPMAVVSIGALTKTDAAAMIDPLRRRIATIAPSSAVHWTSAMADEVALEYAPARFYTVLVAVFSIGALALTSVGLFALLSHTASRRTSEMGLRLALGASRGSAAGLILRGAMWPLVSGIAAGTVAATLVASAMGGMLYGIGRFDAPTFALAIAALVLVSLAAGLLPARRIARVDPVTALRE